MESPRTYQANVIVLRRINVGEADRILTLYTREKGKLSAVAKGARKAMSKLSGATEIFTYAKFFLAAGRELDIVTQSEIKESFPGIRRSLSRIAHATYMLELVSALTEEREPNYELFDTVLSSLYLMEAGLDPQIVARYYELQIMSIMGYRPELDICIRCDAEPESDEVIFSPSLGGRVCGECGPIPEDVLYLSTEASDAMRILLAAEPQNIKSIKLSDDVKEEIAKAMRWHIRYRLDHDLKSMEILQALLASEAASGAVREKL